MPYLKNQHSEHICPLKLYDYLAAGIPIVSVDMPLAREFSQHVHLANTPEVFPQAVREALSDTSLARVQQTRRQVAPQHTWEVWVEQLSDLVRVQFTAKVHQGSAGDIKTIGAGCRRRAPQQYETEGH